MKNGDCGCRFLFLDDENRKAYISDFGGGMQVEYPDHGRKSRKVRGYFPPSF